MFRSYWSSYEVLSRKQKKDVIHKELTNYSTKGLKCKELKCKELANKGHVGYRPEDAKPVGAKGIGKFKF